jgi:hypothetical protein
MVPKLEILILGKISDSSSDKIPSGGLECYALGASMIRKVSFFSKKKGGRNAANIRLYRLCLLP